MTLEAITMIVGAVANDAVVNTTQASSSNNSNSICHRDEQKDTCELKKRTCTGAGKICSGGVAGKTASVVRITVYCESD